MKTETQTLHETFAPSIKQMFADIVNEKLESIRPFAEFIPYDVIIEDVPHTAYDGFAPFTDGGAKWLLSISVSYLISTGYGYAPLQKLIDKLDNQAHEVAEAECGERTDENEDAYFEIYYAYISESSLDFEIQVKLYEEGNFFAPKEGKNGVECRVDTWISIDGGNNLTFFQDLEGTDGIKDAIESAVNFIINGKK